jgi:hypothetical protein
MVEDGVAEFAPEAIMLPIADQSWQVTPDRIMYRSFF